MYIPSVEGRVEGSLHKERKKDETAVRRCN